MNLHKPLASRLAARWLVSNFHLLKYGPAPSRLACRRSLERKCRTDAGPGAWADSPLGPHSLSASPLSPMASIWQKRWRQRRMEGRWRRIKEGHAAEMDGDDESQSPQGTAFVMLSLSCSGDWCSSSSEPLAGDWVSLCVGNQWICLHCRNKPSSVQTSLALSLKVRKVGGATSLRCKQSYIQTTKPNKRWTVAKYAYTFKGNKVN